MHPRSPPPPPPLGGGGGGGGDPPQPPPPPPLVAGWQGGSDSRVAERVVDRERQHLPQQRHVYHFARRVRVPRPRDEVVLRVAIAHRAKIVAKVSWPENQSYIKWG